MLRGTRALLMGGLEVAERHFREAESCLSPSCDMYATLQQHSVASRVNVAFVRQVIARWMEGARNRIGIWRVLRQLCLRRPFSASSPSMRNRAALRLDCIWPLLDAWAQRRHPDEEILRVAFFLKEPVDAAFRPLGSDFLGLMAKWAPRFYERVRAAVVNCVGELGVAPTEARALNAALKSIETIWRAGHHQLIEESCTHVLVRERGSLARNARAAGRNWYDDAALFAQIWDGKGRVRCAADGHAVVAYGFLAPAPAKPAAIVLSLRAERRGKDLFRVSVDAAERHPAREGARAAQPSSRRREALEFQGSSEAAQRVRTLIEAAARCNYPTLVIGETGVGKDLVAKCIHDSSAWREQPIVVASCATTVDSLLESELFGHEKGAFTGAHERRSGYFERANGSTLLLDEVDSMSARMQAALLRVLETGEYRPVGGASQRRSEFRLISTGLPRLLRLIERGDFREDLFYRISTLRIEVPPLREREGDAAEIATAYVRSLGYQLTAGAMRAIERSDWPGNVRQLRHCIQAATLHAADRRIGGAAVAEALGAYREGAGGIVSREPAAIEQAWNRALAALQRMGHFGAWDFAQATGVSRRSAQRHLARLLGEGRIVRVGAGRATRYAISRDALP